VIDISEYEGAAGDVDDDDFGVISVQHRKTGVAAVTGIARVRDRVFEVRALVAADGLSQEDVVALIVLVYLFEFAGDFHRDEVDRVSLAWADGSKSVGFNDPPKP